MRIFHLSDLHIGRQLHMYDLADDQRYILKQIVQRAHELRPDVILIAGDIYDKSVPSGEAYSVFDDFLNELAKISPAISVMIVSGNHDSAQRLQYASGFLEKHHIYVAAKPPADADDYLKKVTLTDECGEVNFFLFPFIKPGFVRHLFGEGEITDYESAFRKMLEREVEKGNLDYTKRNVLVAHQFFAARSSSPQMCDSEQASINIGGLDKIDTSVIKDFDYAALGHIHGAQCIGEERFRYCGTPLKYSVSEEHHVKSITMAELCRKGELRIEEIPLKPLCDVRRIRGTLSGILEAAKDDAGAADDYVSIVLTDEKEPYRPKEVLSEVHPHILEITIDNSRTRAIAGALSEAGGYDGGKMPTPVEAFREFYQLMQQQQLSGEEEDILAGLIEGVEDETD